MSRDFLQCVVHRIDPHPILDGPNPKGQQGHDWETLVETKNHKLKSYRARSVTETRAVDEEEGTLVRIHASQARLNQICDFMRAIGVSFEIV